jgi:hypothetical protein
VTPRALMLLYLSIGNIPVSNQRHASSAKRFLGQTQK